MIAQTIVDHDFLRASTMMVEPARQAVSSSVNGERRDTSARYRASFHSRWRGVSANVAQAARHGIEPGARLVAMPAGLSRSEKCLWRRTSKPQLSSSESMIGEPEIDQMTRHVDAVPALAEQQELPARGIGNLKYQTAVRAQQTVRGVQITGRIVEMFQDVKHGDGGAAFRARTARAKESRRPRERRRDARRRWRRRAKNRGRRPVLLRRSASICRNRPPPQPTSSTSPSLPIPAARARRNGDDRAGRSGDTICSRRSAAVGSGVNQ